MRPVLLVRVVCSSLALLLAAHAASAQSLGTFRWQMAPYCNVLTLNIIQSGTVFTLDGFDAQCGATRRAPVTGVATINPDGTVSIGLTIVNTMASESAQVDDTRGGEPEHVHAVVDLTTLGGPWSDSIGTSGTLVFNGAGGTIPRPTGGLRLTGLGNAPVISARRANGTASAPGSVVLGNFLLTVGARGHNGATYSNQAAAMRFNAAETFTPSGNGTRISFTTTPIGQTSAVGRMTIDHNGRVGIGTSSPADLLDVNGNIRVGTSGANGCIRSNNGGAIAGVCASDGRFKHDVIAYENLLPRVAALRPVAFSWRSDAFPERGFGPAREAGLVAQEVERVLPELVTTTEDGFKAVDYSKLPLLAIQAIKELKEKNDALASQNAVLAAQNAALAVRTEQFERRLAEMEARVKP